MVHTTAVNAAHHTAPEGAIMNDLETTNALADPTTHAAWPAFRAAMLAGLAGMGTGPAAAEAAGRRSGAAATAAGAGTESEGGFDALAIEKELQAAFAHMLTRRPGTPAIRVRPALPPRPGTVIEIVNDDMPFLLDSVMGEIQARGLPVHLALHPILTVDRDADGRLRTIAPPGAAGDGKAGRESYIVVLSAPLNQAAADELAATLGDILGEVRLAVEDWRAMRARLAAAIDGLSGPDADEADEARAFLRWIGDDHFTFLGMRELRLDGDAAQGELVTVPGSGLGLLRDPTVEVLRRGRELVTMTSEVRSFFFEPAPLIVTKANAQSRVHRRVHMDYVGIKLTGADGRPTGELRIVGLFTSQAYVQQPRQIPLLRGKIGAVKALAAFRPQSHADKALDNVLDTFPRDELFQIEVPRLFEWTMAILDLELRPRIRILARPDRFDRFVSVLTYLPRDRFTTTTRERVTAHLAAVYDGRVVAWYPSFPDGGPLVRVHFIVARYEGATPEVDATTLERDVHRLMQTWDDRLAEAMAPRAGGEAGPAASDPEWIGAFSAGYAETFPPERAVEDIARMARLTAAAPVAIDFYREAGAPEAELRAALYRLGPPIPLSERVPVLENMGFRVIDERSFRITPRRADGHEAITLHDMRLELPDAIAFAPERHDSTVEGCFLAVLSGRAEDDGYNRAVLVSDADWRRAAMLRAYGAYLRQIGLPFGPRYLSDVLVRHAPITTELITLFDARFDPAGDAATRESRVRDLQASIEASLAAVESLEDDRILRHFLNLITATKRTNFFQTRPDGSVPETIAFKLASGEVDAAPAPRPFREIWVSGPRVEGVHLRFAAIARGGLRWSDRPLDFRTEVLGLAKAQQVKNAVIVPAGAKGGFVPRRLPKGGPREAIQQEGIAAYRLFVSTLLDLTDNLVDGAVVPPRDVVRHDPDDPYLVVAADKGTATFSDIANAIASERSFWLGDAFASGGSAGYDHKGMGITARGAFECIARHFREMGRDWQRDPFTVAGVGDMSGDVFGNGMLLSPVTRLVAAFDHRDIFLDPDPDPEASFVERRRLFALPRSSWQDYDKAKLSPGGGIFPRSARSIPLSPQVRARLGLVAESATPTEVMRAILAADVDLLYFGGIGTYVRASGETDEAVGDRANDAIRLAAREVRAKIVGEGANLAVTQAARIELALAGGRVDTDFIANSAGVNTSDQEVNIKIALGPATRDGRLGADERRSVLASLTDDVAAAVLRNNYLQSLALSLGGQRGLLDLGFQQRLMQQLEADGQLDRGLEGLPSDAQITDRRATGRPLTRPELAVLLSTAKIAMQKDLLAGSLPDDPDLAPIVLEYMPAGLRGRFRSDILAHPLRREIVAATLANQVINRGGSTMVVRVADETGRSVADITYAFLATVAVFGLEGLWARIDALDDRVAGDVQLDLYLRCQEVIRDRTVWFLRHGAGRERLATLVATHRAALTVLVEGMESLVPPERRTALGLTRDAFVARGVPSDIAHDIAALEVASEATDIAEVAKASGTSMADAAAVHLAIGAALQLGELRRRGGGLAVSDTYDRLAINGALATLTAVQRSLAVQALAAGNVTAGAVEGWLTEQGDGLARARQLLEAIATGGELTVSRLSVAAAQLRDLVGR
jgi:glutamate dehydrogenase